MDSRTVFVVIGMVILYGCAWLFSLCNLFDVQFWDPVYALDTIRQVPPEEMLYNSTAFTTIAESYYQKKRYISFLPHVISAIIWWNLYFIQLIKPIRRKFPTFHRYLGRTLMVVAIGQVITGIGLAVTSHSPTIKLVSFLLAFAVSYCVVNAWYYAANKDFVRHKGWAKRLVGYMQTIALQRFWIVALIGSHQSGWHFLYPSLDGKEQSDITRVVYQMFDDSFVLAIITALLITEWYLAAQQGMMDEPEPAKRQNDQTYDSTPEERVPIYTSSLAVIH